jgi:hypothetical protein
MWHGMVLPCSREVIQHDPATCGTVLPMLCRYKDFLDGVTPAEWFVAQADKQKVRMLGWHTV